MKKILLCIATGVLLISCAPQAPITGSSVDSVSTATGEVIMQDLWEVVSQIPANYLKREEFHVCVKQNIDNCMMNISTQQEEWQESFTMSCDDFLLEENRLSCTQSELTMNAVKEKNAGLCDSLESGKESCVYEVTLTIGMEEFDTTVCGSLSDVYKNSCNNQIIWEQARSEKDSKVCDKIIEENDEINGEKEFCINEIDYIIEEQKRMLEEQAQDEAEL